MKPVITLLGSLLRQTVRNRQGLFWTLFFPVVLMIVFSLLGNTQNRVNLAIVAPTPTSSAVVRIVEHSPFFHIRTMRRQAALNAVRSGRLDAALLVPAAPQSRTTTLVLRYNPANSLSAQQAVGAVQALVAQADLALSGRPPRFRVQATPLVHARASTYLDFLLPGVLALMTMQNSLFGIGSGLTRWKEKGILRRFRVTPLRPLQFLGAAILNYLLVGLASSAIIIGFATSLLHASVDVPLGPVALVLLLGMGCFLAFGFIVAGVSRSQEATIPIINLISFPMMFLSGVFFPVSSLPKILTHIVDYFPLTYVSGALRGLMSGQLTWHDAAFRGDLLGMAVWLAVAGVVAARVWRWE